MEVYPDEFSDADTADESLASSERVTSTRLELELREEWPMDGTRERTYRRKARGGRATTKAMEED